MRELARDETLRCIVLRGSSDRRFATGAPLVGRAT
jgi:hypothetical protein